MDLTGEKTINAPRDIVWQAMLTPDVLRHCIPGCQSLEGSAEGGFTATVTQKVGPVKATFKGEIELANVVTGDSLTLIGAGKGGAAGFAKGQSHVTLTALDDGQTQLAYTVEVKVGGKLAQLGSRVIDGFAKKMADAFFTRFQNAVEPESDAEDQDAEKPRGWFKRLMG